MYFRHDAKGYGPTTATHVTRTTEGWLVTRHLLNFNDRGTAVSVHSVHVLDLGHLTDPKTFALPGEVEVQ